MIEASQHARDWIANLEAVERERTGLKTLKVGYNKVFGYYIEISRGAAEKAPANYIRKQTLVNAERFITPEMKEYETLVLNAEDRIREIELRLFKEICAIIEQVRVQTVADRPRPGQCWMCSPPWPRPRLSEAIPAPRSTRAASWKSTRARHPVVEQ